MRYERIGRNVLLGLRLLVLAMRFCGLNRANCKWLYDIT